MTERICIYLNGARGRELAAAIHAAGYKIGWLVVPPTRADEFAALAREVGAEILDPPDVNAAEFVERLQSIKPRLAIIAGFSSILRRPVIDAPQRGTINLHAGPLPRYRGGSPLNWQIINGEKEAGLSVLQVDDGIDSGAVLVEGRLAIGSDETIAELQERANTLFCRLVLDVLTAMEKGTLREMPQNEREARYWLQRNAEDGHIRWRQMTARQVHDLVRAVTRPYPGAIARLGSSEFRIFRTELDVSDIRGVPGRVAWLMGRGPYVVCADRALLIKDYEAGAGPLQRLSHGVHLD